MLIEEKKIKLDEIYNCTQLKLIVLSTKTNLTFGYHILFSKMCNFNFKYQGTKNFYIYKLDRELSSFRHLGLLNSSCVHQPGRFAG